MSSINKLEQYLTFCTDKNKAIAKNIANVGTKNYSRFDLEFKEILEGEKNLSLRAKSSKHMGVNVVSNKPVFRTIVDNNPDDISGVNNVDVEKEMAMLAENTINFKMISRKVSTYYKSMRAVIRGGGEQ